MREEAAIICNQIGEQVDSFSIVQVRNQSRGGMMDLVFHYSIDYSMKQVNRYKSQ